MLFIEQILFKFLFWGEYIFEESSCLMFGLPSFVFDPFFFAASFWKRRRKWSNIFCQNKTWFATALKRNQLKTHDVCQFCVHSVDPPPEVQTENWLQIFLKFKSKPWSEKFYVNTLCLSFDFHKRLHLVICCCGETWK